MPPSELELDSDFNLDKRDAERLASMRLTRRRTFAKLGRAAVRRLCMAEPVASTDDAGAVLGTLTGTVIGCGCNCSDLNVRSDDTIDGFKLAP